MIGARGTLQIFCERKVITSNQAREYPCCRLDYPAMCGHGVILHYLLTSIEGLPLLRLRV